MFLSAPMLLDTLAVVLKESTNNTMKSCVEAIGIFFVVANYKSWFILLLIDRCLSTTIEHRQWMVLAPVEILKPLHRLLQVYHWCVALAVDSMQMLLSTECVQSVTKKRWIRQLVRQPQVLHHQCQVCSWCTLTMNMRIVCQRNVLWSMNNGIDWVLK